MAKQKMSTKKKASAVVAGALAVVLALGGTYAWVDYSQSARNTFRGNVAEGVLLHDDFDGQNKDVYVENTGDGEVYVRVKFAEYLQIGNNSVLTEFDKDPEDGVAPTGKAQPNDVTTWPVHQFSTVADANNVTCNGSAAASHNYFEWKMTGAAKAYLAGVTEADPSGRGGMTQEAFDALTPGTDFTLGSITTHKNTTEAAVSVMMLSEYLGLPTAEQNVLPACWLLDTDGWAYWSKALKPDTATNLLLDEVAVKDNSAPYDNAIYHINVQLQAASLNEMDNWYANGTDVAVANPDNSIATTTTNGYNFIQLKAGNYIQSADGLFTAENGTKYIALAPNYYREAEMSGTGYVGKEGTDVVAGQDKKIGTDDDNMLAGRSAEMGGEIEIDLTTIDYENETYGIKGADADFVVTTGIDKMMGTYDDVITSLTGALGQYDIDGGAKDANGNLLEGVDDDFEYIGWNYLGGPLNNMLVATEYVLDNVTFDDNMNDKINDYAQSIVKTKIEAIGAAFIANGMDSSLVNTVNDLDMSVCSSDAIFVCTKATHVVDDDHYTDGCTYTHTKYYTTNTTQANITDGVQFFALSIDEMVAAYGDSSTDTEICASRRIQGALKWINPNPNTTQNANGYNYCNATYKDGDGNQILTTDYWLRSPGYTGSRAARVNHSGHLLASHPVNNGTVGARPACYLNLSGTTVTP